MYRHRYTLLLGIALVSLTGFSALGCEKTPTPGQAPVAATTTVLGIDHGPLELKTYDVSPEYVSELRAVVNRMLQKGKDQPRIGRAEVGPAGRLLVTAPAGVHPGVAEIVERLKSAPPEPAPSIEITYWVVEASPAETMSRPAELSEIGEALDAVVAAEGPLAFTPLEKLRVGGLSGEEAEVSGNKLRVRHVASTRGGKVLADVRLEQVRGASGLSTRVNLATDTLLVLGQSGLEVRGEEQRESHVYYVVRARVLD